MSSGTSFSRDTGTTTRDRMGGLTDKARQTASNVGKDLKDTVGTAQEKAKETVSSVVEQAKDMASSVAETASNVATSVGQKAQEAVSSAGDMLGKAGCAVASGVETGGRYLTEGGMTAVESLNTVIRRNPIPAVLVAIGLGYLAARAIHRT